MDELAGRFSDPPVDGEAPIDTLFTLYCMLAGMAAFSTGLNLREMLFFLIKKIFRTLGTCIF